MQIPNQLLNDRYWRGTLSLFMKHTKLQRCLTPQFFEFEEGTIEATALKRLAKPWSESEKFMLNLALHLFNERFSSVNLSNMDLLDGTNKALVFEALRLRFG